MTRSTALLAFGVLTALLSIEAVSHAQTFMRNQGERSSRSSLSLGQLFNNLSVQQRSSTTTYLVGGYNTGTNGDGVVGGAGVRLTREQMSQFHLELVGGQTFIRAQGSTDLFAIDLNIPLVGSPIVQTLWQALQNNLRHGLEQLRSCDERNRDLPNVDLECVWEEQANNRNTTGFGLRVVAATIEGQYLHQFATASPAGSYLILSPSVLVNLLHVNYSTLRSQRLANIAIRIGGSPLGVWLPMVIRFWGVLAVDFKQI